MEVGCAGGMGSAIDDGLVTVFCLLGRALPGFSFEGEACGAGPGVGPESNLPARASLELLGDVTMGLMSSPITLSGSLSGSGALLAAQPIARRVRRIGGCRCTDLSYAVGTRAVGFL